MNSIWHVLIGSLANAYSTKYPKVNIHQEACIGVKYGNDYVHMHSFKGKMVAEIKNKG